MSKLLKRLQPLQSEYVDRRFDGTKEEYFRALELSSTLYIGNLSFYTSEDQVHELFSKVGPVARVVVGLDRNTKTPCGFCFVVYHARAHALAAVQHLNGTKLDNRQLRVDVDYGFEEGRQYGRGRSGGQVRDEFRADYDAERGGYGRVVSQQLAAQQLAMWREVQAGAALAGGGGGGDAAQHYGGGGGGRDQRRGRDQQQEQDPDQEQQQQPGAAGEGEEEQQQQQRGSDGGDVQQQQQQQQSPRDSGAEPMASPLQRPQDSGDQQQPTHSDDGGGGGDGGAAAAAPAAAVVHNPRLKGRGGDAGSDEEDEDDFGAGRKRRRLGGGGE